MAIWLMPANQLYVVIPSECRHWYQGDWGGRRTYCTNHKDPSPWSNLDKVISKALAFPGLLPDQSSASIGAWLSEGQKITGGCWAGPPEYQYGVEISNSAPITGTTAWVNRTRKARCKEGDILLSSADPRATDGEGCYRPPPPEPPPEPEPPLPNPKTNGPVQDCGAPKACSEYPINLTTGNKFKVVTDYRSPLGFGLGFVRTYNSLSATDDQSPMGSHWHHNHDQSLKITGNTITAIRGNSKHYVFTRNATGQYAPDADVKLALSLRSEGGYVLRDAKDNQEHYNRTSQLLKITNRIGQSHTYTYDLASDAGGDGNLKTLDRITDHFGRTLQLIYNDQGRIAQVKDPGNGQFNYTYDQRGNLIKVSYPDDNQIDDDNPSMSYHYENDQHPYALTGVSNELEQRIETYTYDRNGKATGSTISGGVKIRLSYQEDGSLNLTRNEAPPQTYQFETILHIGRTRSISGTPCARCRKIAKARYDERGNVIERSDFNNNRTTLSYNARNLELSRTEAVGTDQARTITTQWHRNFNLPTRIKETGRQVRFNYNRKGQLFSRTIKGVNTVQHITTYHYYQASDFADNHNDPRIGLLKSIDGPRTDLNDSLSYTYDIKGNLTTITNALGHQTQLSNYDAHGRRGKITDANGMITTYQYDARGRLLTQTVNGQLTRYRYNKRGDRTRIQLPTGGYIDYRYDPIGRLIGIQDSQANRIAYQLDANGNRIKEQFYDPQNNLKRTINRRYDNAGRLISETGGVRQLTTYSYDTQGNLTHIRQDPNGLNRTVHYRYDALNRLISTTRANATIGYQYDQRDNLLRVTDPKGLITRYTYNGLNNRLSQDSPDTGMTAYQYDSSGNLISQANALNITTRTTYDALNRPTQQSHQATAPARP